MKIQSYLIFNIFNFFICLEIQKFSFYVDDNEDFIYDNIFINKIKGKNNDDTNDNIDSIWEINSESERKNSFQDKDNKINDEKYMHLNKFHSSYKNQDLIYNNSKSNRLNYINHSKFEENYLQVYGDGDNNNDNRKLVNNVQEDFDLDLSYLKKFQINSGHPGMNINYQMMNTKNFNNYKYDSNYTYTNKNNGFSGYLVFLNIFNFRLFGYSTSEYIFVMFLILIGYFYFFSKTFNDKYANAWYLANQAYFGRFSRVSVKSEDESITNNTELIKDSFNNYRYYAEEFKNIETFTVILEFKQMQDTASFLIGFLSTITDKIVYKVTINPVNKMPNVFIICKKYDQKKIKDTYPDVNFFTEYYQPSNFEDNNLCELAEYELTAEIFRNKDVLHYFKVVEEFIDVIYYTDQKVFSSK